MEKKAHYLGVLYKRSSMLRCKLPSLRPFFTASRMASSAHASADDEVLVEKGQSVQILVLNRPKKLNSLTEYMVTRLKQLYEEIERDDNVGAVILKGNGRAFCAGGDVAKVCAAGRNGNYEEGKSFFYNEYLMNSTLATLTKPHVALLHGVVMGGGCGISIHGTFRVATEKTLCAMPETALGLHPDVGASYFLSHLPGHMGEYIGLTGERLDGADMLGLKLATHYVTSEKLPLLEGKLRELEHATAEKVASILDQFSELVQPRDVSPLHRSDAINACFSKDSVEDILQALEESGNDTWYVGTLTKLRNASPTSLKITLESIRKGRRETLQECLMREYKMSVRAVIGDVSMDFYEGCRAILIDKDNQPQWKPARLEDVTKDMVNSYFELPKGEQGLLLPVREREKRKLHSRY